VNLANLPDRVGGFDVVLDWADILSLGEQQRLAFARLLLTQPRYAILDEATSALDIKNEERLYQQLQARGTTFISVGHRSSLLKYHHQVLELEGEAKWRLCSVQDYHPGVTALA
jgi:putative ATP-binding cassette transporter